MSRWTGNRIRSLSPPGHCFKYSLGLRWWEVITTGQLFGGLHKMKWWIWVSTSWHAYCAQTAATDAILICNEVLSCPNYHLSCLRSEWMHLLSLRYFYQMWFQLVSQLEMLEEGLTWELYLPPGSPWMAAEIPQPHKAQKHLSNYIELAVLLTYRTSEALLQFSVWMEEARNVTNGAMALLPLNEECSEALLSVTSLKKNE